ncbi:MULTISPECIES: FAD:protein FMN transferase [unclassified Microbulbifer]|uniref:FAD:protein FMN transferase n=1 Tax=unclassified Microbulbifer TaxID=2619833 RepID=UPI0027E532A9|nr:MULTISPECIES: FAD:protein FMN transferase [unclassified Microbulbifer]
MLSVTGCGRAEKIQKFAGPAQGTTYHISYWSREPVDPAQLQRAVSERLEQIDEGMSGYRADSTIEQFNVQSTTEPYWVGEEIAALVEQARRVNRASSGCYDLTIKPLFELWGFSDNRFTPPGPQKLQDTMASVGMDKLETVDGERLRKVVPALRVDLSSIAQGFSVARIAAVLEQYGISDYLVEIGGELLTRGRKPGNKPWRVAVERPLPQERSVAKIVTIDRAEPLAVMTSGTYRHFFDREGRRYSHILDARTGRPVEHNTVSVTVFFPDAAAADAWSTALLCLGSEAGLVAANRHQIPALFIDQENGQLQEAVSGPLAEFQGIEIESVQ